MLEQGLNLITTNNCPSCTTIKSLFKIRNVKYNEVNIQQNEKLKKWVMENCNNTRSLPMLFENNMFISSGDIGIMNYISS